MMIQTVIIYRAFLFYINVTVYLTTNLTYINN